ncbi:MAG: acetylxylan esterase [Planctomycetota bacterium]
MDLPDDFGLNPAATLAHVADPTPPPGFLQFWCAWQERVDAVVPAFRDPLPGEHDVTGPALATHVLESVGGARIGCRISQPSETPRCVVVALHGYVIDEPTIPERVSWCPNDAVCVNVRVRGYPGSTWGDADADTVDTGYITIGLADEQSWILGGAVADVLLAVRAARAQWPHLPVSLAGESFGGGLAVIATSLLNPCEAPDRLALGLPTFGDWDWRLERSARAGSGLEIEHFIRDRRDQETRIRRTLRQFDATVHAKRIAVPTICKLACADDVVPAPSAAAVFNALGTPAGEKWRFITPFGHYDGGIANARRHALFERLAKRFLTCAESPAEAIEPWCGVLQQGEREPDGIGA